MLEGNSGITTATFVVQLSAPNTAPVSFDMATGNGSAQAGSDYQARAQAGRIIDPGRTRVLFEVAVQGDASVEPTETFSVTVGNLAGATLLDGAAIGSIGNDDGSATRAQGRKGRFDDKPGPQIKRDGP